MKTRGARGPAYTLLTPGNHYPSRLPNFPGARVIKLVTPRLAPARLAQYLLLLGPQPLTAEVAAGYESFLFGLAGQAIVRTRDGSERALAPRSFAYLPASTAFTLQCRSSARLLWIKRHYQSWPGSKAPGAVFGTGAQLSSTPTDTPGLHRTELLDPADAGFDFNISLMAFDAGVALPFVEIHDEEHGLYMTAGGGTYVLGGDEHPVRQDDFIYTAPYCPQWFEAGPDGAEYLLYEDVYRDGF